MEVNNHVLTGMILQVAAVAHPIRPMSRPLAQAVEVPLLQYPEDR